MIAYKGFNKDLSCTRGKGVFKYKIGKTYKENEAKCAHNGFHCVEEPIEVLSWYEGYGARYCMVSAAGDVNEDGNNKISCTEMTILKELTLEQLAILECIWMKEHPEREYSTHVNRNKGYAYKSDRIVIVRGTSPKAAGDVGTTIFLVKGTVKGIRSIGIYKIDGKEYKPGIYYGVDGREADAKKRTAKVKSA